MSTTSPGRQRPFLLSATVDFPDDLRHGIYTLELLDEAMTQLKSMGVRRVYWNYYGDVDPDSYWAGNIFRHPYGQETLDRIGEPLKAAVAAAHRHGLEIYGVLKPYDTGGSGTFPEGSPKADTAKIQRIGGSLMHTFPSIERYPHTRVRRRAYKAPPDLQTLPVNRIRLLKKDDAPTRVRKENLEIWASPDNYRYERRDVAFTLKDAVEPAPREVRDSFNRVVTAKGAPVRTLTLEGLSLADRYILVTTNFKDQQGDFRNAAVGMVEAYGAGPEPLPIVVATRSALWDFPREFRTSGMEFDSGFGHYLADLDVDNTAERENIRYRAVSDDGVIAFARGKNDYLPSAPCEAYPEVRKLWSGWIDRIIQTGVDGVALRCGSHGTFTDEPGEYGFNEPLVEEYRRRFGADITGDGADLRRLAQLRGEHYTSFLREASNTIRRAGKKVMIHMHPDGFRPDPNYRQWFGFSGNINFDWKAWLKEGLADGSTMRTSRFESIEDPITGQMRRAPQSQVLADPVVEDMLAAAKGIDMPVYLNGFATLSPTDEYVSDLESAFRDDRIAGFDIYELASVALPSPDGSRLVPVEDKMERIRAKAVELGLA